MTHAIANRLVAGQPAPDFLAETWDKQPIRLSALRGKRLWLAFFRHVKCPFCNIRLFAMRDLQATLQQKLQVVAVFQSPAEKFADSPAHKQAWYPLIADPQEKLYALYRLESGLGAMIHPEVGKSLLTALGKGFLPKPADGTFTRIPADFLIDASGLLVHAYYGHTVNDHIPLDVVEAFAQATP